MRKDVRFQLYASLAVLAVSGAQTPVAGAAPQAAEEPSEPASQNDKEIATWSAEKQSAYKAWPSETQTYFWTLSKKRQELFWTLTDPDKVTLSGMTPADQDKAWERIEGRS
ncbi:MAG: hypothetical protein AAGH57_02065 [Pseudomonadota bacterium]